AQDTFVIRLVIEKLNQVMLTNHSTSQRGQQFFKNLFNKDAIYLNEAQISECKLSILKLEGMINQKIAQQENTKKIDITQQKKLNQTECCNRIIMLNKMPSSSIDKNLIYLIEDKESGEFTAHWDEKGSMLPHKLSKESVLTLTNIFRPGEAIDKGSSVFDEVISLCGYPQISKSSQLGLFSSQIQENINQLQQSPLSSPSKTGLF
ncbi:MAG: hypothetical protein JO131_05260, partial [Gammaproteobacteria bacterium]|nr:hypothetical protein [Gammaproteobacteria bacterium]